MRRWNEVRSRLRQDDGAPSTSGVWQRIEASRRGGATITLTPERPRILPRLGLYGPMALALLVLLIPSRTIPPPSLPSYPVPDWSWPFLPQAVLAQGARAPHLPAIGSLDGSRLQSGRWVYKWIPSGHPAQEGLSRMADTVTIRRGSHRGEPVWLVTQRVGLASGKGRLDSLYLRLSDLRPLRHALVASILDRFRRAGAIDFEGDTMRWQFVLPGGFIPPRDTVVTAAISTGYAAVWPEFPLLLNGIQFAKNWTGAVPMLLPSIDWSGRDSPVHVYWIDLRVTGRERVTVPAGTFDCWRISERISGNEDREAIADLWVDSRSGALVRERPRGSSNSGHGRELSAILP